MKNKLYNAAYGVVILTDEIVPFMERLIQTLHIYAFRVISVLDLNWAFVCNAEGWVSNLIKTRSFDPLP